MSYAPYPAYKDSGVPWLGQVPDAWEVKRLSYATRFKGGSTPSKNEDQFWIDGTIPWVSPKDMKRKEIHDTEDHLSELGALQSASGLIDPGHVMMVVRSGILRHSIPAAINRVPVTVNQDMRVFLPFRELKSEFIYWVIEGLQKTLVDLWSKPGTTVESLETEYVNSSPFPVPSIEEQTAIADFLDKKTAEIDDLIAKKEKLLRLLAEQRTALITHAVTKGLNPNAPMKPSGIDWLGDVPEGWEVKPFKREVWYQEGPGIMAVDFRDDGVPLLRIRNLKPGKVELEGCNFLDHDMANGKWAHFQVEEGDRLISTSASTGLVSVVDADAVGAIPYTGIIRIRPLSDSLLPEFLEYFVSSELFFDQIDLLATGTTIQHFGPYHLNQMIMAVPPIEEQVQLIETLASDLSKISETKGMVEIALDRLREYRTALITNAVTGKIKVA